MNVVVAIQDYVLKMLSSTPGMKVLLLDKETVKNIIDFILILFFFFLKKCPIASFILFSLFVNFLLLIAKN